MGDLLYIEQTPIIEVGRITTSTLELPGPYLRRADPDFAAKFGGPVVNEFLQVAHEIKFLDDNTLVKAQPTRFERGTYATPPHWHFDLNPGTDMNRYESLANAIYSNTGLIACVFDKRIHPYDTGTDFLQNGTIELDLSDRDTSKEYEPGKNFRPGEDEGELYWWNKSIRGQVERGELTIFHMKPNVVYSYASNNGHRVPLLMSNSGWRYMLRVNKPRNPAEAIKPENSVIQIGNKDFMNFVFRSTAENRWRREIPAA